MSDLVVNELVGELSWIRHPDASDLIIMFCHMCMEECIKVWLNSSDQIFIIRKSFIETLLLSKADISVLIFNSDRCRFKDGEAAVRRVVEIDLALYRVAHTEALIQSKAFRIAGLAKFTKEFAIETKNLDLLVMLKDCGYN